MKCRPSKIFFRLALLLYVAAVAYLCFADFNDIPGSGFELLGIPADKLVHFCMFFPFPFIGFFAYDRKITGIPQAMLTLLSICSFGCIFAGLTEIVQGSLPYRSEDIGDFGTDCIAIACAALIILLTEIYRLSRNKKKV